MAYGQNQLESRNVSYVGRDLHTIRSSGISKRSYHVDVPQHLIDKCKDLNVWRNK